MIRRRPDTYDEAITEARPCFRADSCGRIVTQPQRCPVVGPCRFEADRPEAGLHAQPDAQWGVE